MVSKRADSLVSGAQASSLISDMAKEMNGICGTPYALAWQALYSFPFHWYESHLPGFTTAWMTCYFQRWLSSEKTAFFLRKCLMGKYENSGIHNMVISVFPSHETEEEGGSSLYVPDYFSADFEGVTTNFSNHDLNAYTNAFFSEHYINVLKHVFTLV